MSCAVLPGLFLSSEDSDVSMSISTGTGHEVVVPGHSIVLKRVSEVFRAMLRSNNFKEGNAGAVELKLHGGIEDAVIFLRYIYTKRLEKMEPGGYVSLLQNAHLYGINEVHPLCEKRIGENLTPLSVCRIYNAVENVASEDFSKLCLELMVHCAFFIFRNKLHIFLSEKTMKSLLCSDTLNVLDEEQVLKAVYHWGFHRCALKGNNSDVEIGKEIANLLRLIRWRFIEDIDGKDPWYVLPAFEVDKKKEERKPEIWSEVTKHAEVLIIHDTDCVNTDFVLTLTSRPNRFKFTVDRDILLAGFLVQIILFQELSTLEFFEICMDEHSLCKEVISNPPLDRVYPANPIIERYKCNVMCTSCKTSAKDFCYTIKYRFVTPMLLTKSRYYNVWLNSSAREMCLPRSFLSNAKHVRGSDGDLNFCVSDEKVYGFREMYYYL